MEIQWQEFWFEDGYFFGKVRSPEDFQKLVGSHGGNKKLVLSAKMTVYERDLPTFGFLPAEFKGELNLNQWLQENHMDQLC